VPPAQARLGPNAVVLVHRVNYPGRVWRTLIPALLAQKFTVCNLDYLNDQPIAESAQLLASELRVLNQFAVDRVDIIAHSMGGLVSRELLTSPEL